MGFYETGPWVGLEYLLWITSTILLDGNTLLILLKTPSVMNAYDSPLNSVERKRVGNSESEREKERNTKRRIRLARSAMITVCLNSILE